MYISLGLTSLLTDRTAKHSGRQVITGRNN